jgi:hypothetical protein
MGSGQIECHFAKQCVVKQQHSNGEYTDIFYNDGETVQVGGKSYKCNDGKWEARSSTEGGRPGGEQPKNATEPGSPPPTHATPPPPAGTHV